MTEKFRTWANARTERTTPARAEVTLQEAFGRAGGTWHAVLAEESQGRVEEILGAERGPILPELFLTLAASLLLRVGAIVATTERWGYPTLREQRRWLSVATAGRTRCLRVPAGFWGLAVGGPESYQGLSGEEHQRLRQWGEEKELWGAKLVQDPLSVRAKRLLAAATAACLVGRRDTLKRTRRFALEYPVLRLFALLGGRLLASANDLLILYLALELQSLSLYVLAAFRRGSAYSTEAGLKYFVLGAFASGLYLFGCSLVYGSRGTTNFGELALLLPTGALGEARTGPVVAGFTLIVAAFLFKLTAAPYHRWGPDVREGSPTASGRFFAAVAKLGVLVALARLCWVPFHGVRGHRTDRRRAVAALSRVVGSLAALRQRRWKRFRAYSTVGHRGYLVRALGTRSGAGLEAFLLYRLVYTVRSLNVWSTRRSLRRVVSTERPWDGGEGARVQTRNVTWRSELAGLGTAKPAVAFTLAAARFSRAGIPPRAGFRAKYLALTAALEAGRWKLSILAILTAVVGAFYYLRWIKVRFFESVRETVQWAPIARENSLVRLVSLAIRVLLRVQPAEVLKVIHRAAEVYGEPTVVVGSGGH